METLIAELAKEIYLANQRKKHTVFFDFSGHVNTVNIHAYKGKWNPKSKRVIDFDVRLYTLSAEDYLLTIIEKLKTL